MTSNIVAVLSRPLHHAADSIADSRCAALAQGLAIPGSGTPASGAPELGGPAAVGGSVRTTRTRAFLPRIVRTLKLVIAVPAGTYAGGATSNEREATWRPPSETLSVMPLKRWSRSWMLI